MLKLLRHPAMPWVCLAVLVLDVVFLAIAFSGSSRAVQALAVWERGRRVTPADTTLHFMLVEEYDGSLTLEQRVPNRKHWNDANPGTRLTAVRFPGFSPYGTWAPVRDRESIAVLPIEGDPPIGEDTIGLVGEAAYRVMLHEYRTLFDPAVATPQWFTERARRTWDPEFGFRISATKLDPIGVLHNCLAFAVLLLCLASLVARRFVRAH